MTPEQTARLDAHEREITGLGDGQRRLWQDQNRTAKTVAATEVEVRNQGEDIRELKRKLSDVEKKIDDGFKDISDGQVSTLKWMAVAAISGLGLTLTFGLWLAERIS